MAFQSKYEVSGNLRNFILTFQFPLLILETRKTKIVLRSKNERTG